VKTKERCPCSRCSLSRQEVYRVDRDLNRSKYWASYWLKRYDKEDIEGLKTRTKSGRLSAYLSKEEVVDLLCNCLQTDLRSLVFHQPVLSMLSYEKLSKKPLFSNHLQVLQYKNLVRFTIM
jgi:hypothetical protein